MLNITKEWHHHRVRKSGTNKWFIIAVETVGLMNRKQYLVTSYRSYGFHNRIGSKVCDSEADALMAGGALISGTPSGVETDMAVEYHNILVNHLNVNIGIHINVNDPDGVDPVYYVYITPDVKSSISNPYSCNSYDDAMAYAKQLIDVIPPRKGKDITEPYSDKHESFVPLIHPDYKPESI